MNFPEVKFIVIMASVAGLALLSGCGAVVTVTPDSAVLEVGDTVELCAVSTNNKDTIFAWVSDNEAVATVSGIGLVSAVALGTTKVSATGNSSGKTGVATITVLDAGEEGEPEEGEPAEGEPAEGEPAEGEPAEGEPEGEGEPVLSITSKIKDASFSDPTDPDDPGWGGRSSKDAHFVQSLTSGNPLLGGHGSTGTAGKQLQIQSIYDSEFVYMHFLWDDATRDDMNRAWVFDGASWGVNAGDEDRLFVSFPIIDGPGREGRTFAEIGCAMLCHQWAVEGSNRWLADTTTPVNDCSLCHVNAPGSHAHDDPPFQHVLPAPALGCAACHGGVDYSVLTDGVTFDGADMFAPEGTSYDMWHWKAQRSNPLGVVEDQYTADGNRRARDGSNLAPNNVVADQSIPRYIWVDGAAHATPETFHIYRGMIDANSALLAEWNAGTQQYERLSDGTPVAPNVGDVASRAILRDDLLETDNSANTFAHGVYDEISETWAVVVWRTFVTSDTVPDRSVNFDVEGIVPFSVAVTDNTGSIHHGLGGPIFLNFGE